MTDSPFTGLDTYTWVRRTVHELMGNLFMQGHDGGDYAIVMHRDVFDRTLVQAQLAVSYNPSLDENGMTLFGMPVVLDSGLPTDYIGLRHEVGNR